MTRDDRRVHRAGRHLATREVVLGSAVAVEVDGRRGRVVLLTDDRLLLAPLRAGRPIELSLTGTSASFDPDAGVLTLREGESDIALRDIEPTDARQLVELLEQRQSRAREPYMERVPHVRIIEG